MLFVVLLNYVNPVKEVVNVAVVAAVIVMKMFLNQMKLVFVIYINLKEIVIGSINFSQIQFRRK